jgi:hypothetical protein
MLQWYAKLPALENVLENVPPAAILPLSKLLSSAVTVCAMLSLFVQVTVAPTVVVMEAGEKAIPAILTALAATGLILPDIGLLFLEQETNTTVISNRKPGALAIIFLAVAIPLFTLNNLRIVVIT